MRESRQYVDFERGELSFTWGDHIRILGRLPADALHIPTPDIVDRKLYRSFVVPSEVSHRWYIYFTDKVQKPLGFYGLTPSSRGAPDYESPSNTVGKWAYTNRFPTHYGETIGAYASPDADAYARWGILGVFVVTVLLFLARLSIQLFSVKGSVTEELRLITVFILAVTLPSASLQAILVAHGLLVILLIVLALYLFNKYATRMVVSN